MSMDDNFKTHKVYIDYPLNAANLKDMEGLIDSLGLAVGDVVLVDCTGMEYICSSGLRFFLKLYHDTAANGGKIIIKGLHPLVKGVFDMSGFSHIFNIEE